MSIWNEGIVVGQKQWTESLYSIFIEAEVEPFTAGQFCRIALEIDGKKVPRPYSFVNAPDDPIKEFYYIHVPNGLLTPQLVALTKGSPIYIAKKGAGLFTLDQVQDAETLWCFATGTALGVYLSILKTQLPWQRFKHIVLVHSVRFANELTHQDLIATFQQQHQGQFSYVPFTSREQKDGAMFGRITRALESGELEAALELSLTPDNASTMLCGNPHMVKDMQALLEAKGLSLSTFRAPGRITIENYWKD